MIPSKTLQKTVLCASDSSKLRKTENRDCALKCEQPLNTSSAPKSSWQAVGEPDAPTCKLSGTQGTSAFWKNWRHHCLSRKRVCNFTHPKQHSPFPERLKLPYPDEEILSGYEEEVSITRDGFTTWVKADFNTILERHAVDFRKALAEFREASVIRPTCLTVHLYKNGSASTTGIQDLHVEEKALLRNRSQASGMSSHCRKRLNLLTTSSSRTGST